MRDLIFKNLTSNDRRRKIIASIEHIEQQGVSTNIYRHFLCHVLGVKKARPVLESPRLYIFKKKNTQLKTEDFYCRIKGSVYLVREDTLFLVDFIHSLRISLKAML